MSQGTPPSAHSIGLCSCNRRGCRFRCDKQRAELLVDQFLARIDEFFKLSQLPQGRVLRDQVHIQVLLRLIRKPLFRWRVALAARAVFSGGE